MSPCGSEITACAAVLGAPDTVQMSNEGQSFGRMWTLRCVVGGIWWEFWKPLSALGVWH